LSKLNEVLKKPVNDMTDLEKWAVFFRYADVLEYRETVNKVIESKEVLQVAGNLLMNVSKDEKERAVFRSRRMFESDRQSNIATAEKRKTFEIARNLLLINLPVDQITAATGLTIDEIKNL